MQRNNHNLRNIGIIAHVDAGKTTVTERILLFTGKIHKAGDVHHGNTTTDSSAASRAHGITISAAAITAPWKDHLINLIDTPGHIDFNIDVRSSLRVLDGAVVVFDAVAGVEPQTETNWRLANDYDVARIGFINKLDRVGADFDRVCEMIRERLDAVPLPLQIPMGEGADFEGVIDLLNRVALKWPAEDGREIVTLPVPESLRDQVEAARRKLIELLADHDEEVADAFLTGSDLSVEAAQRAIRKGVAQGAFVPLLGGSALKNKGVQPLLDAVVDYLPAPAERPVPEVLQGIEDFAALVFKTSSDQSFGQLSYCRLYSGELTPGMTIWNAREQTRERVSRIYRMQATDKEALDSAQAGDIVALAGLEKTRTGDTLSAPGVDLLLESIVIPEPVTSVVLEAANRDQRDKLAGGLERLSRGDPTLHLHTHPETGQLLLSGMGELHLQIAVEELQNQLGIEIHIGQPQVAYRETLTLPSEVTYRHKKQNSGPGQFAVVTLRLEPLERGDGIEFVNRISGGAIPADFIPAVERGIRKQAETGLLANSPFVDFRAILLDGQTHPKDSSALAFEFAGGMAFREAASLAGPVMLEPVMQVSVTTPEAHLGNVIGDLSRRRGLIQGQRDRGNVRVIEAQVPLAAMFGYIGDLRSITEGRGDFVMEFSHYAPVPSLEQERLQKAS